MSTKQLPRWVPTSRRSVLITAGAGVLVVAGLLTWALWPEPPRQREYLDATACLLTDEQGVTADPAGPVWRAMQAASVKSLVRVQNLQVNGPQTADNAAAHLASMTGGGCGAILAVGPAQIEAVTKSAGEHREIRFLTVGGGAAAENVQVFDATDTAALEKAIQERLDALADDAG
ncbi:hypothetical protein [Actinoplanes sp. NPDC026670]|uniref:hypothetical protein n=1 Tax=Actinoplanes sp. NPDC026670 TaxID=3154700 RepID=UPI0033E30A71